jgi:two-component system sensor histidine kinase UhpB
MRLRKIDGGMELSVEDDGVGISGAAGGSGMGLKVMHYRAARIGAALEIRRREGGGTSVICRVPRG